MKNAVEAAGAQTAAEVAKGHIELFYCDGWGPASSTAEDSAATGVKVYIVQSE